MNTTPLPAAMLMTMRIIVGSMLAGTLTFAAVAVFVGMSAQREKIQDAAAPAAGPRAGGQDPLPVVSLIMALLAAAAIPASFAVPGAAAQQALRTMNRQSSIGLDDAAFWRAYQTQLIVACGLLEGPAFANLIAFMVEQQWWSLGIAGFCAALIALRLPSAEGVEEWVRMQRQRLTLQPGGAT